MGLSRFVTATWLLCYFTLTRVVKRLPLVCIGSCARGYLFTLYRLLPSAVAEGVSLVASVPVDHAGKEKKNCDLGAWSL